MSKLDLVYYPDQRLKITTKPVEQMSSSLKKLAQDMIETMYAEEGIGLAAPQVGSDVRLTVIDVSEERDQAIVLFNPEITAKSGKVNSEEGCLSIPGYRDVIKRSAEITVKARDINFEEFEIEAEELLARCLQHEIDHLDGVLFIDHLSRLKKDLFKKWFQKNAQES